MDRRLFLTGLGSGVACGLVAPGAAAAPSVTGRPMLATYVTNIDDVLGARPLPVQADETVRLVRVPTRAYDPNTVAVVTEQGEMFGYLPTDQSKVLSAMMDAGLPVSARIGGVKREPRRAVSLEISVGHGVRA